ncbi:hypothetical protein [Flavobacterium humi]|uniref:PorT family protein n=1 Tax=Flavobacterium humi TaxID=2562683 RepID=A0A4Z0L847_9FLAO|nr:hypothetical protein [Flavobacterium humi]TGD57760.1 hypothetical protein E4635_11325 [Flavobacterium humi]
MRNLTIYLVVLLCAMMSKIYAQKTFSTKAELIASSISNITKAEKDALKRSVEAVNVELDKGNITKAEADEQKKKLAEATAAQIEKRVAVEEAKLTELVKQKVDGTLSEKSMSAGETFVAIFDNTKAKNDTVERSEKRTTSQFVYAVGVNNLMHDGMLAHSNFRYMGSHFYEWGITYNTRILKANNLLHLTYGFSVMYNTLRATDNRYFVENGNQTNLEVAAMHLKDSRFKNVNLVVPMYLEFDFSGNQIKDDKPFFRTHKSARFGLGGFAGVNLKTKQTLKFEDEVGNSVVQKTKGNFNTNDFVYGVGAYIGYKETSLYIKYDLNPLFKNNAYEQNNISLGVRFDLN